MILIENLDAKVTRDQLDQLISQHGEVESIQLADDTDEDTRVAFVTMKGAKHGRAVIDALDGKTHWEQTLNVSALKQHHEFEGAPNNPAGGPAGGGISRRFGGRSGLYGHKGRGKGGGRHQ
jgi:hypothetical protein